MWAGPNWNSRTKSESDKQIMSPTSHLLNLEEIKKPKKNLTSDNGIWQWNKRHTPQRQQESKKIWITSHSLAQTTWRRTRTRTAPQTEKSTVAAISIEKSAILTASKQQQRKSMNTQHANENEDISYSRNRDPK